jgi:hypothetical protein
VLQSNNTQQSADFTDKNNLKLNELIHDKYLYIEFEGVIGHLCNRKNKLYVRHGIQSLSELNVNRILVTRMKKAEFLQCVVPLIDLKLIVDEVQFGWTGCGH